jgi:hypothetical protein
MTHIASDGSNQAPLVATGTPVPGTDAQTYKASDGSMQEALPVDVTGGGGGEGGPVEWVDVLNKPATFPPIVGITATTAKAGDYAPTWGEVTNKPAVMGVGATQQEAREAIGALNAALLGQPGGVAQLDPTGSVPLDQLNVSSLTFKGAWYPSTNTPTLLNGTGSVGDFYKAAEDGSFNFGNGSFDFFEGDWVMFAAGVWQRLGSKETVSSVNGKMGAIVLTAADVGALPDTYTPPTYTPPAYQAIHVQEQKSNGTIGGATVAGSWATRALSAVKTNTISGASFASNAITLPAGTYKVNATGCTYFAGSNLMRLTADGVSILQGLSSWSSSNQINNFATLQGVFTLATSQTIRLQHRVSYGHAEGWGRPAAYDGEPETYAEVFIEKVG